MRLRVAFAIALAAATALAACDALVGGRCAEGFIEAPGACLPGSTLGPSGAGGAGPSASVSSSASSSAIASTAQSGAGGASSSATAGGAGPGTGGAGGGSGCMPPLSACPDGCVDLLSDAANCGACGNACPTEICEAGKCVGTLGGHLVVVGMSFAQSNAPTAQLLGNATFLAPGNPLAILDYRKYTKAADAKTADDVIAAEAQKRGRTFMRTLVTTSDATAAALESGAYRVLFVHDQPAAPTGEMAAFGAALASSLAKHAKAGGTVVVLATGDGSGEMGAFLGAAGLLSVQGFADTSGKVLTNQAPNDVVGVGVPSPFLAKPLSATITTSEMPGAQLSFVVIDKAMAPVVIHKALQ